MFHQLWAARQVHDATAIGDERQELLGQEEHSLEMNINKAIKKLFRGRLEWGIQPDARVVDESVDVLVSEPTQLATQRGGKGVERTDVSGIQSYGDRFAAEPFDLAHDLGRCISVAMICDDDVEAASCSAHRRVAAETTATTGHKNNLGCGVLTGHDGFLAG